MPGLPQVAHEVDDDDSLQGGKLAAVLCVSVSLFSVHPLCSNPRDSFLPRVPASVAESTPPCWLLPMEANIPDNSSTLVAAAGPATSSVCLVADCLAHRPCQS